ncbi:MAG: amidase [Rhodospirillales bacterium]|jgi:Asp-tRNA(Asn)/Glu-tRNA(Gln) amidotransferase A subunit family amidase|nr:amidase [Rhodospirillales bacterium]
MSKEPIYDPRAPVMVPFHSARPAFMDGIDSPRAYLERCIQVMEAREGVIKAFVNINLEGARRAADAAGQRYKDGRPASVLDGMPLVVKDVIDTEDMPTEYGSEMFIGRQPEWDAACIYWLRRAGVVITGKTVTAEFATRPAGPTRNPYDLERTPGGSSSGSGAAVGAGMAPVGLGTQVRGSVLRPASYCGTYAIKPTYGVITLNGILTTSRGINHLGTLAASLEDAWLTLHWTSRNAGGEISHTHLPGKTQMPAPARPDRLIRLETVGWQSTSDEVKAVFEDFLDLLAHEGCEIIGREDDPEVDRVERMFEDTNEISSALSTWEGRYPMLLWGERGAQHLSEMALKGIEEKEAMDPDAYIHALQRADAMRQAYGPLAGKADACIALTADGPAPKGMNTGDVAFCDPFSLLHVPALTLPIFSFDGLPLGLQLTGFAGNDARLVVQGAWIRDFALG